MASIGDPDTEDPPTAFGDKMNRKGGERKVAAFLGE
jgi:hypothetical protein